MTNKVAFFYCHGTNPLILKLFALIGDIFNQPRLGLLTVPGLNGVTATWQDGSPGNDCFTNLLDPNIFQAKKIGYPALGIPMKLSMSIGVENVRKAITDLPRGQKFMLGGYSQGAAVIASCYDLLRYGSLQSRNVDFLGAVNFGSPRRQTGYRGEVGGTWSGAFDIEGSTTGGHGSFPATGEFARLTNCEPNRWIEFAEVNDVITSVGDSQLGLDWTTGNGWLLNLDLPGAISSVIQNPSIGQNIGQALGLAGTTTTFTDAVGRIFDFPGAGHTAYPWRPPPGNPDNGLTSFQIALKWVTAKANALATSPILLPETPTTASTAGWTTTLIPPA